MILYAIRHATTALGHGPVGRRDVPIIGSHGDAAAAVIAALPAKVARVWSSPLSRCAVTAHLVALHLGVPHVVDERLLEVDYGRWEGLSWDSIAREHAEAMAAWTRAWEHEGPPGGESARDVARRVSSWRDELHRERPAPAQLLVAHAGVVRALRVVCGVSAWSDAMSAPVPNVGEPGAMAEFRA